MFHGIMSLHKFYPFPLPPRSTTPPLRDRDTPLSMDGADETAELFSGSEDGPPEDTAESAAVIAASDNEEDMGAEEEAGDGEESRSQSPKAFGDMSANRKRPNPFKVC